MTMKKTLKELVLNVVLNSCLVMLLMVICSCNDINHDDKMLLDELVNKFKDKYELGLEEDLYIILKELPGEKMSEEDAFFIYKRFYFEDFESRIYRNTTYVYLNTYTAEGRFLYQIHYDPKKNKFIKPKAEYY